jgi:peptide-methionine (S)-S-oxide reductase
VIFYHTPAQQAIAAQVIEELSAAGIWKAPIVTAVVPFTAFYRAEDYHQEFFQQHPEQLYCQFVISPKVAKFRKEFLAKLKP